MTTETNAERLKRLQRATEIFEYPRISRKDSKWLIERVIELELRLTYMTHDRDKQAERAQESEALIRKLYNHLGSSAELDFKLWKETEVYVIALAGEVNGQRKA